MMVIELIIIVAILLVFVAIFIPTLKKESKDSTSYPLKEAMSGKQDVRVLCKSCIAYYYVPRNEMICPYCDDKVYLA